MNDNKFHIAVGADESFAPALGVMLLSALRAARKPHLLVFHVIHFSLSVDTQTKLRSIAEKFNASIQFYTVDPSKVHSFLSSTHFNHHIYLRYYIPQCLPQDIDRVLYLDSDIVVYKDLSEYFRKIDISKYALAASEDIIIYTPEVKEIRTFPYFNSGVLYINMEEWRKVDMFAEYVRLHEPHDICYDQDVLNRLWKGRWLKLPLTYQLFHKTLHLTSITKGLIRDWGVQEYFSMRLSPVLVHFITFNKPWRYFDFTKHFLAYRWLHKRTPWKHIPLPSMFNYFWLARLYWIVFPYSLRKRMRMKRFFTRKNI